MNKIRVPFVLHVLAALCLFCLTQGHAATMQFNQQRNLIYLEGDMRIDDIGKFDTMTAPYRGIAVQLSSPGGDAIAGVRIGELIRKRSFVTFVMRDTYCASACAVAWLGGAVRIISAQGHVGFHGVYNAADLQQSGPGNAVVGSFLGKLGLSDAAIVYITHAGAREIQWLNAEDARRVGIEAEEAECTRRDCSFTSLTTHKIESMNIEHEKTTGYYTTTGADEIAELITSITFLRDMCGRTVTYFDEDKYASERGYQLEDFGPERQYARFIEAALQRQQQFLKTVGKDRACFEVFNNWLKDPAFAAAWVFQMKKEGKMR